MDLLHMVKIHTLMCCTTESVLDGYFCVGGDNIVTMIGHSTETEGGSQYTVSYSY